jgi:predicted nucleotidyltransferase
MYKQEEIISFLNERYHPIAIILHGSRTKDDAPADADWDFVLVVEKREKNGPVLFKGERLDVDFAAPNEEILMNSHGYPLSRAVLLTDANGIGKGLIERTKEVRSKGKELSSEERENRKQRLERTIARLERWREDRLVSFGYEALFYQLVLRYWFELKNLFPENTRESIEIFREKDKEFLDLLEKFITEKGKSEVAEAISKKLFW